ncbi:MAG TPA: fumarylacetoacetate hydrolase family protein [Pseudolabrys sp.]|uniref:fumarylacetoacetate hydrolase family protein n=1 Tax=Pseudolabrys sp. TaxID=1960880 RepID=UPI002DDCDC4C|nr:fumarylacetoacetate hydrolase family protein [Pseudolabrys sp.]HEV2631295.1 fumarylacetoacetate hydrolase family protein [Pseudolabrys sp.]
MKLASYKVRGRESYGAVVGEGVVDLKLRLGAGYDGVLDLLRAGALDKANAAIRGARPDFTLREVELLPPVLAPEKILCIGINYANRNADYGDQDVPKYPSMFYRAPSSLVAHMQPIVRPRESIELDYEGEIALVIGKGGRRISQSDALHHVAGVTLCNEGTIRDWIRHGKFNVTQGKNWDATGSIGPWIVTSDEIDLAQPLHLTVKLNDDVTQDDTTANLIKSFTEIIAYVSTFMTLKPGDIIVTGTPVKLRRSDPPVGLKPGDTIEITCPQIGTLRNMVVAEQ